ncbi:hypothetical protein BZA70DRAFT_276901 [Myxozyma melibiosi]|uniref:Ubiquitin thioesterase OTU n=1 Tax=Myxozyma melibiosi TaxID=54550 RepID=A0ABR1F7I0_9ASCO
MRLKARLPSSESVVLTLADTGTVADLLAALDQQPVLEIKAGFPPKAIDISDRLRPLSDLGVRSGDQLVVVGPAAAATSAVQSDSSISTLLSQISVPASTPARPPQTRSAPSDTQGPPSVPCTPGSVLTLRVMEDDNSCLFRAVGYALLRNLDDTMPELRTLVATAIRADPEQYSDAVLGKPREQYCEWIQRPQSWGGAIELAVLATHFGVTIHSVDVASGGRVDSFNDGQATFIVVVYSGIHYDTVALAPEGVEAVMSDFDQTVFVNDETGEVVFAAAKKLAEVLMKRHYFTDVASFQIRCTDCGSVFTGEREAEKHSMSTGHTGFQEVA